MAGVLENLDRPVPTVPVNDGVATLEFAGDAHGDAEAGVWAKMAIMPSVRRIRTHG